jgi:beta-glucuronidase
VGAAIVCGLTVLAMFSRPVLAATRTDLDQGWQFRADPDEFGDSMGWNLALPPGVELVSVPHTWNVGRLHDFMGVGWYFLSFRVPSGSLHSTMQLHFDATFYKSRVWLNGKELGGHEGGFTAYAFDVTSLLEATNYLAVRIDNRPGSATIPGYAARGTAQSWYDWWTYGGLVRSVWLSASGPAWVDRQSIRAVQAQADWEIRDRLYVHSTMPAATTVQVRARAFGPGERLAATTTRSLALGTGDQEVELVLRLVKPRLWGIDHPNVYRMVVELSHADGRPLDMHSDTFGVRSVEIRDRRLLINGERMRLVGVARHEDSPAEGLAESPETMRRDYDDLKTLHTSLSRPVHYPQNPYILDYADRHGILLIPEIPVWQFSEAQLADPNVRTLAAQQMREMIEQAGNHPSILGWSVANESAMGSSGGIGYFRAMRELIRKLDPDRLVSFADDNLPKLARADQSAANEADFLMMNQYFGSWHGPSAALEPALDKVHELFPDKMVIVSEFGYPGTFASQPSEADRTRSLIIERQLPILASRDWIGGAILWCYQDYKSHRNLSPGMVEGFVDHGLVDEMRRPKPSYQVWKRATAPALIEARWLGAPETPGFEVTVTPASERELPYFPLRDYQLAWKVQDDAGITVVGGARHFDNLNGPERIGGALPAGNPGRVLHLVVTLLGPSGVAAAERTIDWPVVAPVREP